jgi:sulfoxide reductase heme-binding subunit YedZ
LEKLLHQSGEIAIWLLGTVLALTPLRVLFPHSRIVTALNRHRRAIGVAACIYGLIHFSFHVVYEGGWDGLMRSLSKPFIWFGLSGLSILVALALTSNNRSIRTLGGKNWKLLHRLAYVAAAALIYHQAIAGKGHWAIARWLLFPLATLQLARLIKTVVRKKGRNTALPSAAKQVASIETSAAGTASRRLPESASDHSQGSPMRQARANANRRCFHPA